MNYEDALRAWGVGRLTQVVPKFEEINPDTVRVEINMEEGFTDPDPESYGGSCWVEITGRTLQHPRRRLIVTIDQSQFNFATVLGEIVTAGNGVVTA